MNFLRITVKDQADPDLAFKIQDENNRTEIRTFSINLDLVLRYTRETYTAYKTAQYLITFYLTKEDSICWKFNSKYARDEAFKLLEEHLYPEPIPMEIDWNVEPSPLFSKVDLIDFCGGWAFDQEVTHKLGHKLKLKVISMDDLNTAINEYLENN